MSAPITSRTSGASARATRARTRADVEGALLARQRQQPNKVGPRLLGTAVLLLRNDRSRCAEPLPNGV